MFEGVLNMPLLKNKAGVRSYIYSTIRKVVNKKLVSTKKVTKQNSRYRQKNVNIRFICFALFQ